MKTNQCWGNISTNKAKIGKDIYSTAQNMANKNTLLEYLSFRKFSLDKRKTNMYSNR